ncbi:MAG: S26 family signal peptidase [Hyphomonadaceae bacterium]|nr:S26 family signal peptidase [Hyphomonadaceae bacterium]
MRRRLFWLGLLVLLAAVILTARFEPLVIFNSSPSVPTGFYLRTDASPARGAFVTVRAATVSLDYARMRRFSDASDRFIKRVAAGHGEIVCAQGATVTIGSQKLARASHDSLGRPLPRWSGCRALAADEIFLIGDTPDSFDSRYWGPVPVSAIDGVWAPLRAQAQR